MSRYVVTGGGGFVGSHLTDLLLNNGHSVVVVDNFVTGSTKNLEHLKKNPQFELVNADVSAKFPEVGKIDGLFHMASPASPIDFIPLAIPILQVGSYGTFHALEYAQKHSAWFLMASTSEVYGDPEVHPQREEYLGNVNPIGIRGVYDEAKRFSEAVTMAFHRAKKVKTSIVRIFNTYGPRMRANDGRVIPNFITQALTGQPLTLHGAGNQTRSFCYVEDLVRGIYRFSEVQPEGPINLGNNLEMKVKEAAEIIIRLTNSKSRMIDDDLPEGDPKRRCPDIGRAKRILSWSPTTSLEEGLRRTIDYFKTIV